LQHDAGWKVGEDDKDICTKSTLEPLMQNTLVYRFWCIVSVFILMFMGINLFTTRILDYICTILSCSMMLAGK
jgi:hypothetical protein